jgi:hypothetical protein
MDNRANAEVILDLMGDKMNPRMRKNFEQYAAGKPCCHAFCVGDDDTGKLECSVCGKVLGDFNPSIDRVGEILVPV